MFLLFLNLDQIEEKHPLPYFMDWNREEGLYYGAGFQTETGHVYYQLTEETIWGASFSLSFYCARFRKTPDEQRDFRQAADLLWSLFGEKRMHPLPQPEELLPYAEYAYRWAFHHWKDVVWQEFSLNGKRVGGAVFIVTAGQKPGLGREHIWREPKSLWNQAWFCGLRSAYGYYRYGRDFRKPEFQRYGLLGMEFALSAPKINGFFASYYMAGPEVTMETGHWVMSAPRRPEHHENYVHLLDCSWTCLWMLKWYQELYHEERLLQFVQEYTEALLKLENSDGSYPAWIDPYSKQVSPFLQDSPECAVHAALYCKLFHITKNPRLKEAACRIGDFLIQSVMPNGRWEDFETYWSCSKEWDCKKYGIRELRSGLYHQCNFSIDWCCEALLALYELTHEERYLRSGEQALAELSLYQQLCRPEKFAPETLGGFGVMNTDDEWNDARQSLFALTYLRYYRMTGKEEYRARAYYSMKASFYMMYCPEKKALKTLYEKVHPQFDENDYGFMMENFNHSDGTQKLGLGEFSIFDWGGGAACSSLFEFISLIEGEEKM